MKYIVYKTTNLINGKIYIGVHRTNPDIFDGYIGCGVTHKDKKKKAKKGFPKAVQKYGYDNFKRETLFEFPDTEQGREQAYKKEKEIVNISFIKRKDTYNLITGGTKGKSSTTTRKIAQYTIDGKFIRVWESIHEAEENLNLTSLRSCLCGNAKYCSGFQWKYYNGSLEDISPIQIKEKNVFQFDLSGNLVKSWKSITIASQQFNNPKLAKVAICAVCKNKKIQAYGYYWSYKNKFEMHINKNYAPVAKYDDFGNFLESYTTIAEAAKANGINTPSNIINCIKGYQKHCGGYRWRYFYGNKNNIKPLKDNDIV